MNEVVGFIKKMHISKNEKVIVACSGGPDSMCLLHLLNNMGFTCVCAHVNHKVRSESEEEYEFLSKYCEDNGIIFEGIELTDYVTGNFELYARNFRYSFFKSLIDKYHANYLFTAHHGDDLVETILMRLTRGSSLKGYVGFNKISKRDNYMLIRPLIYLNKEMIDTYNKDNNVPFRLDYTNDLDDYTRNRFRHKVLPFLKEEDNLVHLRFLKYSEELKESIDYITSLVQVYREKVLNDNILDIPQFKQLDKYMQKRLIYSILEDLYPDNLYLVNANHIEEIIKVINSKQPNIEINLPNNIGVLREYNKLYFNVSSKEIHDYEYIIDKEVILSFGTIRVVDKDETNSNYVIHLNSKNLALPLKVRNAKAGDKMQVKNMKGHKKINDIFIDNKINKRLRSQYPVVLDANDVILWLPGLKKSNFDIPINAEYDIILRYEKGEKLDE